ncbi:MAG: energy-coupling factor transporter ATPase [Lachnospiraceae bacterium]|nr:energy-coupling factor transporter ATPase [Lachnospiraceae bacterium]
MSIIADHIVYKYNVKTHFENIALDEVSFKVEDGEYLAVIGQTGSGKSTLIQLLNGLLKPDSGTVYYNGEDIFDKDYDFSGLRGKMGLMFQYPEYQLFEEDVFSDVCFGPQNLGLERAEVELRAYEALKMVDLKDEAFYRSPFELSGGEKKRVALAGILAMKPQVLMLDEPTAGLDPAGKKWLFKLLKKLRKERDMTIIFISHNMDEVAENAERIIVMDKGNLVMDGKTREVFSYYDELTGMGLDIPTSSKILHILKENGISTNADPVTLREAADEIERLYKARLH